MLSFASATGNLFNRLGKLGLLIKQMRSYQNSQLTNITDTTIGAVAQYTAESDLQALLGGSYIGQLNSAGSIGGLASNIAEQTLNRIIFRDQPQLSQTLTQLQITTSLTSLIQQMKMAGASVLVMTVAATPTLFTNAITNVGNGVIVASVRRPFDGLMLENAFAENLLFTCLSDSYNGSATAGNEGFAVNGTGSANPFDFNWPLGSNANTGLAAIDGNSSNSAGNGLTNSGFETFTGNSPNNFVIEVGTAGTQVFQEISIVYDPAPSNAVRILGDGTTLTTLSQTFNSSAGTSGVLNPQTQYSVNLFLRRDGVAAAAGQMVVELTDGFGAVINDANGQPNTFTINLTTLTTNYAAYNGVFRTPVILPAVQKIRLRQTAGNALTTGRSVYIDKLSMGIQQQIYRSGPFIAIHAGSIPFAVNDYSTCQITNSRGAAGTLDTFQTLFSRLFFNTIYSSEFILPSSNTPTLSDNALIA